jgi:fucose permease
MAFLLLGVLTAAPGTFFAGWGYHLQPPFARIALHLTSYAAGLLLSLQVAGFLFRRVSARNTMIGSAVAAMSGLLILSADAAMSPEWQQNIGFAAMGAGSGGLLAACFRLLQPIYEESAAATVNIAGGFLGIGCLCPAVIGWICYSLGEFRLALIVEAGMAAATGWLFFRSPATQEPPPPNMGFREVFSELWSPMHVLFAALLFFQTAAEFSVAQWTALHLTLRSGMSPGVAMQYLAWYFFLLWVGRYVTQILMEKIPHRRLLLASAGLAWFGLTILGVTANETGATLGLALTAAGYSAVYPLMVEKIGDRFANYHASLFHGIFGLAMMGGFLAPAMGGWLAHEFGVVLAMRVPLVASFLVFFLLVLLWLEAKISVRRVVRS